MSIVTRARADLAAFLPYASARRSGFDAPIHLDANECPWDDADDPLRLNRYPSPQPARLVTELANLYGVPSEWLWVGRGSDEAIDLLIRAFCMARCDNVATITPTFGMYRIGSRLQGVGCRELTLSADDDFRLDVDALLGLTDADTRLVILCSPNNPTGTPYHGAAIEKLAARLSGRALLVIDEAYLEFSGLDSVAALIERHDNVAVLRTLSKAHALAGARIGTLIAAPDVIELIARIAPPYPLPATSIAAALVALQPDTLARTRQRIAQLLDERERVAQALRALPDVVTVWPSAGNFLLVRFRDAQVAFERALAGGVLVRDVSGGIDAARTALSGCLRISIGRREDNDTLLDALRAGSALLAQLAPAGAAG